jgi:hypothetical protein
MTEAEWLACSDAQVMYTFVGGKMSPRQRQLFAHACGRRHCRIWEKERYDNPRDAEYWLPLKPQIDGLCARALDTAEEQLDGVDCNQEIQSLRKAVFECAPLTLTWALSATLKGDASYWVGRFMALPTSAREQGKIDAELLRDLHAECLHQAGLFREILGNPFRPVILDPCWLTSTVTTLARLTYESRDFSAMPILADALQDAGCDSADLLEHCRAANQFHVRGCWVVDLVLDKK